MKKKYSHDVLVGVFVIFGFACLGYITVRFGEVAVFERDTYALYAEFSSVSGLRAGNPVEMFGMEVGRVEGFHMDQERQVILAKLLIQEDITVYEDALASIETAGLIGDRYVDLHPGGALPALEEGGTILDTEPPVNISDIIGRFAFGGVQENGEARKNRIKIKE